MKLNVVGLTLPLPLGACDVHDHGGSTPNILSIVLGERSWSFIGVYKAKAKELNVDRVSYNAISQLIDCLFDDTI